MANKLEVEKKSNEYVANLRALYLLHQNHHWICEGDSFYGKHLLFQRIYESAQENADSAAEKLIGLYGKSMVSLEKQADCINEFLTSFAKESDVLKRSLQAEQNFQKLSKDFYKFCKDQDIITLGLDDLILSIANDRETAIYLLKQNLGNNNMNIKLSNLANRLQKKVAQSTNLQTTAPSNNFENLLNKVDVDGVGEMVLNTVRAELGLKRDLEFADLKLVTDPSTGKESISWKLNVPADMAKEYNMAVEKKKMSTPGFSTARLITQLFNKYAPDTAVLPAQPIMVG